MLPHKFVFVSFFPIFSLISRSMKECGHSLRIIKNNRLLPLTCDQCFTFLHTVREKRITSKHSRMHKMFHSWEMRDKSQSNQIKSIIYLTQLSKLQNTNWSLLKIHVETYETSRKKDIVCVLQCDILSCLSPRFACYFLFSYDDQRKIIFTIKLIWLMTPR